MHKEIDRIQNIIQRGRAVRDPSVLGIGDDCSGVRVSEHLWHVCSTDCLVEGIHFRRKHTSPQDLGWKTLAVNLSDIFAMGATPKWCQLTIAGPQDFFDSDLESFMDGFYQLADAHDVLLQGGDLSGSDRDLFLDVTATGVVSDAQMKKRSGFKPGTRVFHVGPIGMSLVGLCILEGASGADGIDDPAPFLEAHRRPQVLWSESSWLAQQSSVLGMMDTSDGVYSATQQLQSLLGIRFRCQGLEVLDFPTTFVNACRQLQRNPLATALSGGEDFGLLVAVEGFQSDTFRGHFEENFETPIYDLGTVVDPGEQPISSWTSDEASIMESLEPHLHFS